MDLITKSELFYGISQEWKTILDIKQLDNVIDALNQLNISKSLFSPHPSKFFEFARLTPHLNNIKVVILGMDPYPNAKSAHGLAFSCLSGNIPYSLKNIYTAITNNGFEMKKPYSGDLTNWAKQGILLLNIALSTKCGFSGAHIKIWKPYIDNLIHQISCLNSNLIWLLWGSYAQKYQNIINEAKCVLMWRHPSPTAQTMCQENEKFKYCNHFKLVNNILEKMNLQHIVWDPNEDLTITSLVQIKNQALIEPTKLNLNTSNMPSFFNIEPMLCNNFFDCNDKKHIIFTDGGCHPNNKSDASIAGYSAIFACGPLKNTCIYGNLKKSKKYPASNIRAEGMAIIRVLKYLLDSVNLITWQHAIFILDCKFWIEMIMDYMPKWNNTTFDEKANSDMTKTIWKLWNNAKKAKKTIILMHMNSHNKSGWKSKQYGTKERFMYELNNQVDELATYARLNMKSGTYTIMHY